MIYLVTGAAGYLGNTLVKRLFSEGRTVRAFVLPSEKNAAELPAGVAVYTGNVLEPETLDLAFRHSADEKLTVIHCAGIVTVATKYNQTVYDVNVTGTENVIAACERSGAVLVYVSSVHAIPELPYGKTISETNDFSPDYVRGLYSKTKAEATAAVLEASKRFDCRVVHPSGMSGPGDYGRSHLTQLLTDFCRHKLTSGISTGGYDFADVRDVADGIISCCDKGRRGECYILSNRYYSIRELLGIFAQVTGKKPVKSFLPIWFAKGTAGLSELYYKLRKQPPLYTAYSLYTLTSNSLFSHKKADDELGYTCRPMTETVFDTYNWLLEKGRL